MKPFQEIVSGKLPISLLASVLLAGLVLQMARADDGDTLYIGPEAICGEESGDTIGMSRCVDMEIEKAERWRRSVVESYAQMMREAMDDLRTGGNEPFDQVAQLQKSELAFELYREESAELAYRTGFPGSGSGIESGRATFRLTIERVRFLLHLCWTRHKLGEFVDLNTDDWCPSPL